MWNIELPAVWKSNMHRLLLIYSFFGLYDDDLKLKLCCTWPNDRINYRRAKGECEGIRSPANLGKHSGIYFSNGNRYCVANSETLPSRILNTREHD